MKVFLTTTAMLAVMGFPALVLAQTAQTKTNMTAGQVGSDMPGFLANRAQNDLFASELIGRDVYARRMPGTGTTVENTSNQETATMDSSGEADTGLVAEAYTAKNSDGSNNMALMSPADLDGMDNIGQINEIVLSNTGEVRAIVIGVGGFLGVGEQDVAVKMDQVSFASDAEDPSQIYVVVNTGADLLKTSPPYNRTAVMDERAMAPAGTEGAITGTAERTAFVAPKVARDGYNQVAVTEVSSEMLVGKSVYGLDDASVGEIDDLIVDEQGAISNVIIDFGGFLGMGTSQVSVGFDELTILADEGRSDVRVYVDATKEQVQAQPRYEATN